MPNVERIAHRGSPRQILENTLPSFLAAFQAGADAVELDVHVSADGLAVVHHDPALGSKVDPAEFRGRPINQLAANQLKQIRLGPEQLHLPTLAEVMDALTGRGTVYVEIKDGSESVVAGVLAAFEGRCAVHSFDHAAVARMHDVAPAIPRGILIDCYPADVVTSMRMAHARDVWPAWRLIDQRLIDAVHGAGGRVIPWTVNSRQAAADLIEVGVDAICTDDLAEVFSKIAQTPGGAPSA